MQHRRAITAAAAAALISSSLLPLATASSYLNTSAPLLQPPLLQPPLFVPSTNVSLPGHPTHVVFINASVAIGVILDPATRSNSSLFVLDTAASPPRLAHQVPLPSSPSSSGPIPITLSRDGATLFLPLGPDVLVIDVGAVLNGPDHDGGVVVLGVLGRSSHTATASAVSGVTLSSDEKFAFVSEQHDDNGAVTAASSLQVYNLSSSSFGSRHVGSIELPGSGVASSVLNTNDDDDMTADGATKLYVVTQVGANDTSHGTLSVVDVETLERDPALAQQTIRTVRSAAGSAGLLPSADGQVLWVACRDTSQLLAFDTQTLDQDQEDQDQDQDALLASAQVGAQPRRLVFLDDDERYILTADTDGHDGSPADGAAGLTVVDAEAALDGKESGFFQIPTACAPTALAREGALLVVAQYESMELRVFNVGDIVDAADGVYLQQGQDVYETVMGKSSSKKKKKKKKKNKDKSGNSTEEEEDDDESAASIKGARGTWLFGGLVAGLLMFVL